MYTGILSLCAAIAGVVGMAFYSMPGSTGGILIILAIAIGCALDTGTRGYKKAP